MRLPGACTCTERELCASKPVSRILPRPAAANPWFSTGWHQLPVPQDVRGDSILSLIPPHVYLDAKWTLRKRP